MNKAVTAQVQVKDGELDLEITSPAATLCLNLCYIKIYLPEELKVTPTPEPTMAPQETLTPAPTEAPESTVAPEEPTEAPAEPTQAPADANTSADSKSGSALPLIAGGAAVLGAIAGALTYFFKKKRK